jgi:hypothetical protein
MRTIVFKKIDDVIQDEAQIRKGFDAMLKSSKNGQWEIAIGKPKRNVDQNALLWMWLNCLFEHTGTIQKDLYKYYCEKFLIQHCTYNSDGKFVSGGTSTIKMNVFANLLTSIQSDAAVELDCQLPTRDDLNFADFQNQYEQSWQGQ